MLAKIEKTVSSPSSALRDSKTSKTRERARAKIEKAMNNVFPYQLLEIVKQPKHASAREN